MLIKDEASFARQIEQDARAAYLERVKQETLAQFAKARIMEDGDLAPNNPLRQMGRVLTPHQLEADVIAKFRIPNLVFETHPTNRNRRCMYQIRGADKHLVCVYENNPMPEFSIIQGVVKWVPDPDYLGGARTVRRADLKSGPAPLSMEKAADILKARGVAGFHDEMDRRMADYEPSRLGMKKIVEPGAEKVRGWRTVLVYMMNHELISPEQLRAAVGDGQRATWQAYLDRRMGALPAWLN